MKCYNFIMCDMFMTYLAFHDVNILKWVPVERASKSIVPHNLL